MSDAAGPALLQKATGESCFQAVARSTDRRYHPRDSAGEAERHTGRLAGKGQSMTDEEAWKQAKKNWAEHEIDRPRRGGRTVPHRPDKDDPLQKNEKASRTDAADGGGHR